jgi:glycosyltransferase involved in cell wall biosynthesis
MNGGLVVVAPNRDSPFVEQDVQALRRHFPVTRLAAEDFPTRFHLAAALVRRFQGGDSALLLWFLAPRYALELMAVSRSFRRPIAVMTGGLEVDYVRELGLGGLRWPHNRLRQRLGLKIADLVLAMSEFSSQRIRRLARPKRLELVRMGVDVERFSPAGEKESLVLTVCFEITRETSVLKGLPVVVDAARRLPNVPFVVVGRAGRDDGFATLRAAAPANVTFTGRSVLDAELLQLYRRAAVYVQVSAHEGFGVAAAESMACGCVPVVTGGHALREVVGDTGLYGPFGNGEATARAVVRALASPELGAQARRRVADRFSLARRIERLTSALRPLVNSRP